MTWQSAMIALLALVVGGVFLWVHYNGVSVGEAKTENKQLKQQEKSNEATKEEQQRLRKVETTADAVLDDILSYWMRP